MKVIDKPLDPEFIEMLEHFKDVVYSGIEFCRVHGAPDKNDYHTEMEYLEHMIEKDKNKDHEGFPEIVHTYGLNPEEVFSNELNDDLCDIKRDITNFLGARNQAVALYYPENGFMGWHHNANAKGFNILISHSEDSKGFFRYRDPQTEEIVTLYDKVGWNIKVGYYGSHRERDKIFWHCARTYDTPRLTLGYIIPDENMWNMMAEDIFIND